MKVLNIGRSADAEDPLRATLETCKLPFLAIGVFSLAINLLMLTTSIYMMQVFDRVLTSGSSATLLYLTLIASGAVLVLAALEVVRGRMLAVMSAWMEQKLAPLAFAGMIDGLLDHRKSEGDPLRDLTTLRGFIGSPSVAALFDAPWIPLYLGVVYMLHPLLGYIALAGAAVLFSLALINDLVTHERLKQAAVHSRRAGSSIEIALRNAELIDAMGLTDRIAKRWSTNGGEALQLLAQAGARGALVIGASKFVRLFVQVVVLAAGAVLVLKQELSGGEMIAASIVMARALAPLEQAIGSWKQAVQALEAKRRLTRFFQQTPRRRAAIPLPEPKGRLSVEGVVHGFLPGRPPILKGVSFQVEPGEALGIIGPSAAGKSTLARLLVGIERPNAGIVRLDGADVFAWPRTDLGRHLGYLPQDVELFPGTVAENIARLDEQDPEAVISAATLANCHEMILRLDAGYATELGVSVNRLSGGQRQRIALARALYGSPKLIVLDEPNAHLDAEGDAALNNTIAQLKSLGTTIVVIGHRLNTFAAVDTLLVLVEGAIQQYGPRSDVLEKITRRTLRPLPVGTAQLRGNPEEAEIARQPGTAGSASRS